MISPDESPLAGLDIPSAERLRGCIAELRREMALRRAVYPGFIRRGKLSAPDATTQWLALKAAHDVLLMLSQHAHGNTEQPQAEWIYFESTGAVVSTTTAPR